MKILLHKFIQVLVTVLLLLSGTRVDGVEYYVKPTTACPDISTHCPVDRTCQDLDTYISNSSSYFSPDNVNISLYFLCGVHNQTLEKQINIQDLHSFVILGMSSTVTIYMPVHYNKTLQAYTFTNVSNVTIANVTIISLSIAVRGKTSMLIVKNADSFGHCNYNISLVCPKYLSQHHSSFIILSGSHALFENSTFQQNVFVRLHSGSKLVIKNCSFHSYCDDKFSAISVNNSTVCLEESSHFFNNNLSGEMSFGAAIFLHNQSILNISKRAYLTFTKNEARSGSGGAIYAENSCINVLTNAVINFIGNRAKRGGAVFMFSSSILYMSNYSTINFRNNAAKSGGAIFATFHSIISIFDHSSMYYLNNNGNRGGSGYIDFSSFFIKNRATIMISKSTAKYSGGALHFYQSQLSVINATLKIENNSVESGDGGAMQMIYTSLMLLSNNSVVHFKRNNTSSQGGAICLLSSTIETSKHSTLIFENNSAMKGGALYLSSPWDLRTTSDSANITFSNNFAMDEGGAIYASLAQNWPCFLAIGYHSKHDRVDFDSNFAGSGIGMHIYGGSIRSSQCDLSEDSYLYSEPYCGRHARSVNISFHSDSNKSLSPVSSDPVRVCLCDANGKPQCAKLSKIFLKNIIALPGEAITISLIVVGQDFGATRGFAYVHVLKSNSDIRHHNNSKSYQWYLNNAECLTVNYTVNSTESGDHKLFYLHTSPIPVKETSWNETAMKQSISEYNQVHGCIYPNLLTTPVYFNITMLRCPTGFTLKQQQCQCFSVLINNQFNCYLLNNKGYLNWNGLVWVGNAKESEQGNKSEIWVSQYCPVGYCKSGWKTVELGSDPDVQCAYNHAGLLCGGCKENFSLAIGSSQCINCTSNSYLALIIFFVFAGPLLVTFLFFLNLTVSQGLINGIVFYANTVWDYKLMLTYSSQPKTILLPFQIFIAWLNMDFGVETCLFVGLTAFWKTWLQFLFPLYIWAIAGLLILICRHSTRAINLIGDRAVPLLATLFYLSYMKVLRTVVSVFNLRVLTSYPSRSTMPVWYVDGNLPYFKPPHVYLFAASVAASVFFCIPFTLFLLSVRWLRKISHLRLLRWVNKFTPIYDACFASLHNNHHQLFGILLLIRGVLLIILTISSNSSNPRTMNLLVLFIVTLLLLLNIMFSKQVFKSFVVKIFECVSILNLTLLSFLALYSPHSDIIIMEVSIGFAFLQFCVITVLSFWKTHCKGKNCNNYKRFRELHQQPDDAVDEMYHERVEDPEIKELLIPETSTIGTY